MEPTLAEIRIFAGNFAPRSWALCQGQLLPINQNQSLFSLLGTTFGGDGRTTFGLPDMRGRAAMHAGHGPGLSDRKLGAKGGQETVTLNLTHLANHAHHDTVSANITSSDSAQPNGHYPGVIIAEDSNGAAIPSLAYAAVGTISIPAGSTGNTGGSRSFSIEQPFLGLNFIIAIQGLFPSRS